MSDADKLFEELGYEKHSSKTHERFDLYSPDDEHLIRIVFNKMTKRIAIHCDGEALDMQELKAINKKCEELRMGGINNGINSDNFNNMFNNYWIKCY